MSASPVNVVQRLETLLSEAKKQGSNEPATRQALIRQLENLQQDLEPPVGLFFKTWTSLAVYYCLDIAVKLDLFEKMKDQTSVPATELGRSANVDENVIARVMRPLVTAGIVASTGEDEYAHTARSLVYTKGANTAVDSFNLLGLLNAGWITLPTYLKTRPPHDFLDIKKSPYACAYGMEGKTFYETLSTDNDNLDTFNRAMSQPGPEYGIFPFARLQEQFETSPEYVFAVDVGGGKGQALTHIRDEIAPVFGTTARLVLQDRPDVLAQVDPEENKGIENMSYDFHTEQPVKGAHVYYLSQIVHNYPDHECDSILGRIAEAMSPHSRLLIVEAVLPAEPKAGGDMGGYLIDIVGLVMGGKERTEKEFAFLLQKHNLELIKTWPGKARYQAVIEARLRQD